MLRHEALGKRRHMPDAELSFGDVVDLRPVPVDDDGNLFISPVIHDWDVVT